MVDSTQAATSLGSALTTAAIAAIVGGLGWSIAYVLAGWRDDRTKRLQLELEHGSSQIREFYAPLVALTEQLDTTVNVLEAVTKGKADKEYHVLAGVMYNRFFLPLHEQINEILKTKVHLLEGTKIPESFNRYFEHYATEKAYWNLAELKNDVSNIQIPPYPAEFYHDVRAGYGIVIKRYEDTLQELRQRRWLFDFDESLVSRFRRKSQFPCRIHSCSSFWRVTGLPLAALLQLPNTTAISIVKPDCP